MLFRSEWTIDSICTHYAHNHADDLGFVHSNTLGMLQDVLHGIVRNDLHVMRNDGPLEMNDNTHKLQHTWRTHTNLATVKCVESLSKTIMTSCERIEKIQVQKNSKKNKKRKRGGDVFYYPSGYD